MYNFILDADWLFLFNLISWSEVVVAVKITNNGYDIFEETVSPKNSASAFFWLTTEIIYDIVRKENTHKGGKLVVRNATGMSLNFWDLQQENK